MGNVTVELRQGADVSTAVLSWQQPEEPNGEITQYQVSYAGYNATQVRFFRNLVASYMFLIYSESIILRLLHHNKQIQRRMAGRSCHVWSCQIYKHLVGRR